MDEKQKILDIAMNLNRIGNWAADDYSAKKERIKTFISSTTQYVESLNSKAYKEPFKNTLDNFLKKYPSLKNEGLKGPKNPLHWAEKMMTWGNILTHRSKLIQK
ncbi:hypothetical protein A2799_03255 [Candidatus Roizmanbacteria bacterium RIFCSPHIGHO2_01_FULL_39_24]|uniref:Uncharacterized protein n=1 Tax=Candidatus Roizmanbacteria bacterium RIFCSPHIGHO2_01_FULL_39_24 TaxID=1802032 RepID=A0A1F7GEX5_9BACT|nr:MAG: hypothetical protein A2799_03255 [Candidatus Roizmanbacteria bacterium RIFCSPHIGHO2_01_FULL_39_24]